VAVSADGARVATAAGSLEGGPTGTGDNSARVWDARSGAELLKLEGHTRRVSSITFVPGGTRVVTGGWDNIGRIWDVATGAELLKLQGHTDRINGVAVFPGGDRIVTAAADNTARIWDASSG